MPLTHKQARFCEEYTVDFNATQAAIRAGYSAGTVRNNVTRMMTNDDIKSHIDQLITDRSKQMMVDAYYVIENLKLIVQKGLQEVPAFVGGEQVGVMEHLNPQAANKALDTIGKHLGMFTDKTDLSFSGDMAERILRGRQRIEAERTVINFIPRGHDYDPSKHDEKVRYTGADEE